MSQAVRWAIVAGVTVLYWFFFMIVMHFIGTNVVLAVIIGKFSEVKAETEYKSQVRSSFSRPLLSRALSLAN